MEIKEVLNPPSSVACMSFIKSRDNYSTNGALCMRSFIWHFNKIYRKRYGLTQDGQ